MSEAVAAAVVERRAPVPEAPGTLEATGLSFEQLRQLFVKSLYTGEATGLALAERLRLPFALLEQIVEHVRLEKLVEVRGATGGGSAGYKYGLTDSGVIAASSTSTRTSTSARHPCRWPSTAPTCGTGATLGASWIARGSARASRI